MNVRTCVAMLAMVIATGCGRVDPQGAPAYDTARAERRPLVLTVEAAGVIEPVRTVEIKSKASGEILELGADTGDTVKAGALLARIDPRTPRNRLDQAAAELNSAKAKATTARSQLERGQKLLKDAWINQADYDNMVLAVATADAEVVTARVAVDNARIALDDTEVRAPSGGTILEKQVERGQVISSPTMDVGGGTLLMTMADLSRVEARVRVDETDVGKIMPEMPVSISVASFPAQRFSGKVEKIEPQAVVEQNVTLFPVLITLANDEGVLRPGMNVDARFEVARKDAALTIPMTALRTERDVDTTASVTGIDPAAIHAVLGDEGPGNAMPRRTGRDSAVRLGGRFWVVRDDAGRLTPVAVVTGVTDLDRVEVVSGLKDGDTVLVLPSSSLIETQERVQSFVRSRGGIPGMNQQGPDAQGGAGQASARGAQAAGGKPSTAQP
jgi:HlyD family secretion protein